MFDTLSTSVFIVGSCTCLFSANVLPERIMTYQLNPWNEWTSIEFESKYHNDLSRKWDWKCRLPNDGHYDLASMCRQCTDAPSAKLFKRNTHFIYCFTLLLARHLAGVTQTTPLNVFSLRPSAFPLHPLAIIICLRLTFCRGLLWFC